MVYAAPPQPSTEHTSPAMGALCSLTQLSFLSTGTSINERDWFDWDFSIAGDEQYNRNVCLGRQIVQFVELMNLIRNYLI